MKKSFKVAKVDAELGIVFGFGFVCHEDGEPYYDLQGDHITEDAMLKSASDFMQSARTVKDMHKKKPQGEGSYRGTTVFAFPLTQDIAKSLDITTKRTGLLVGIMPDDDLLEKYKSGEYTGFSIGGEVLEHDNA